MDLSEVYSNRIKKNPINNFCVGSNFAKIERDPSILELENDVFSKMKELLPQEEVKPNKSNSNEIKFFSFEDAIKELQNLKK